MELNIFNQAKKIRDKISELQDYKIDLQKAVILFYSQKLQMLHPKRTLVGKTV